MTQFVLDPDTAPANTEGTISINLLPQAVRKLRFVPNFNALLPGDLILSREKRPGWIGNGIVAMQQAAGFAEHDSCWTHAAVALYDDLVVEAVPWTGVRTASIFDDCSNCILRVRRFPNLAETVRYRIALRALQMLGVRYSAMRALTIGFQMQSGWWNPSHVGDAGRAVICSQVFHDATVNTTRKLLDGCGLDRPITPAHLSATTSLDEVKAGWLQLIQASDDWQARINADLRKARKIKPVRA